MGDINTYRLRYLSPERTFGKSSASSLGWYETITNFPEWTIWYSIGDMYHLRQPGIYLNRKEFPVDYPIWFNSEDVANGYDTVVEEALEWMNNLVYGHNVLVDINHGLPGIDTIKVSATIENPNSYNVQAQIFIQDLNNNLIDSLELFETEGSEWQGNWLVSNYEEFFKLSIKATDQSNGESFIIENINRITTAGPIVIDSLEISYFPSTDIYHVKPHIKNAGQTLTLENVSISMFSDDTTITSIAGNLIVNSIDPGEIIIHPAHFYVQVDPQIIQIHSIPAQQSNMEYLKEHLLRLGFMIFLEER
jgi:hypothetical protein